MPRKVAVKRKAKAELRRQEVEQGPYTLPLQLQNLAGEFFDRVKVCRDPPSQIQYFLQTSSLSRAHRELFHPFRAVSVNTTNYRAQAAQAAQSTCVSLILDNGFTASHLSDLFTRLQIRRLRLNCARDFKSAIKFGDSIELDKLSLWATSDTPETVYSSLLPLCRNIELRVTNERPFQQALPFCTTLVSLTLRIFDSRLTADLTNLEMLRHLRIEGLSLLNATFSHLCLQAVLGRGSMLRTCKS